MSVTRLPAASSPGYVNAWRSIRESGTLSPTSTCCSTMKAARHLPCLARCWINPSRLCGCAAMKEVDLKLPELSKCSLSMIEETGGIEMKRQSNIKADDLNPIRPNMTVQESKCQQQRTETLKWISENALSALRLAWRS